MEQLLTYTLQEVASIKISNSSQYLNSQFNIMPNHKIKLINNKISEKANGVQKRLLSRTI